MPRFASRFSAGALVIMLGIAHTAVTGSAANATVTDTEVTTSTSQTFDDGNTATVSFANGAYTSPSFNGVSGFNYLVALDSDSSVTVTFTIPVSDLDFTYGFVDFGDFSKVSTNVSGPGGLDLTDPSIVTSHLPYSCPPASDCVGMASLTASGLIQSPDSTPAVHYNGEIKLHFATPITSITVLGPSDRPNPGGNVFGFSIPVVTHTVTFNSNFDTPSTTPQTSGVATDLASNTFSRSGFVFAGWNDQADGLGVAYAEGANFDFAEDKTLFAQWTPSSVP